MFIMDIERKKIAKNAFRVTKKRGLTAARVRVPGGHLPVRFFPVLQNIAEKYGNGTVHITARQGFEIPDIKFENIVKVKEELQEIIEGLSINQEEKDKGYSAAGTRNIISCIGNRVCPFGCYDTTEFAQKVESLVFPNNLHFKIAFTGCHNDCAKVRMHDFGIIGMTHPQYNSQRCVTCKACVKACEKKSTAALTVVNYKIHRNHNKCIGCGECVLNCPTAAWQRSTEKYYRFVLMGRTGKRNPRLAEDFVKWFDEENIVKIILNTYKFVKEYIDPNAPGGKEHIGYIIDRTGFHEYKKWALEGVEFSELAEKKDNIYWDGIHY